MRNSLMASCVLLVLTGASACKTRDGTSETLTSPSAGGATSDPGVASEGCEYAQGVWNNVYGSRYVGGVSKLPPLKGEFNTVFKIYKDPLIAGRTFVASENAKDGEEIPRTVDGQPVRPKAIHAVGSVGMISFVPSGEPTPYTGLFASGAPCGLIRLSLAVKPSAQGINPGAAIKFYVDRTEGGGQPRSVNLHVMHQLDPLPGYNFFAEPFSNVLPPPIAVPLIGGAQYFKAALTVLKAVDTNPGHLTVEHLAAFSADGQAAATPKAPYRLTFVPSVKAQELMQLAGAEADFRMELGRLAPGDKLFDVFADETTTYHAWPYGAKIGEIVLKTAMVPSRYGDEVLHFMHHTARRP